MFDVENVLRAWGFEDDALLYNALCHITASKRKDRMSAIPQLETAAHYLDLKIKRLTNAQD